MANDTTGKQSFSYRDSGGEIGKVSFYIHYDSTLVTDAANLAKAVQTQIAALSNAVLVNANGPYAAAFDPAVFGAVGFYENVEDKLVFTWQDSGNSRHRMAIPAPKSASFGTDGETALTSALANLVTAMGTVVGTAVVASRGGAPFTKSLGGQRARRKTQSEDNIYTKLSGED